MSPPGPQNNPIHRLALELDAFDRVITTLHKEVCRESKMDVAGINWEVKMVLRYLHHRGPQTISQLACLHKTSRQYIAEVVASLLDKGFVTMSDNPKDKRSKLVQLSEQGAAYLRFSTEKMTSICECLEDSVDLPAIEAAIQVLRQVRSAIDAKRWRGYDRSPYRPQGT